MTIGNPIPKRKKIRKKKKNNLEIGVCCKTRKEHLIMLTLIVYIQHCYRARFEKRKRIYFKWLTSCALKELEKRESAFYPFPKNANKFLKKF